MNSSDSKRSIVDFIKKHKLFVCVVGSIGLLSLLFWLTFGITGIKSSQQIPSNHQSENKTPSKRNEFSVRFTNYSYRKTLPIVPAVVQSYAFKNTFTTSEIQQLSQKLGASKIQTTNTDYVVVSNMHANEIGYGTINTVTGAISYAFLGTTKPTNYLQGTLPQQEALLYLKQLGIADDTVTCPITYQKKPFDSDGVIYVECHRDWNKTRIPILSPVGVLNIDTNKPLQSQALGMVNDTSSPRDPNIINVSTGQNGYARPSDFNTATVALKSDGTLVSLTSNIRRINKSHTLASQTQLATPQEALDSFMANKASYALTIPQGQGDVNLDKVYQHGNAVAETAEIKDYVLTYLELPGDQKQTELKPYYMIRGDATLSTGYHVAFTQAIPATRTEFTSTINSVQDSEPMITNTETNEDDSHKSLQMRTFTPPTITPIPPTPTVVEQPIVTPTSGTISTPGPTNSHRSVSTPTPGTPNLATCSPIDGSVIPVNIPGLGTMRVTHLDRQIYFVSSDFPLSTLQQVRDAFTKLLIAQYEIILVRDMVKNSKVEQIKTSKLVSWFQSSNPAAAKEIVDKVNMVVKSGQAQQFAASPDLLPSYLLENDYFYRVLTFSDNVDKHDPNCYISGLSPALFLYPNTTTDVIVSLPSSTTYTIPGARNGQWRVTAFHGGTLKETSTSTILSYLYYEYDPSKVPITELKEGLVVKYGDWEKGVMVIAQQTKLTSVESKRLIQDVQNELSLNPHSKYLKLSVIPQVVLDTELPLDISPKPDVLIRLHILITPEGSAVNISQQHIQPLIRTGFTSVELGARFEN